MKSLANLFLIATLFSIASCEKDSVEILTIQGDPVNSIEGVWISNDISKLGSNRTNMNLSSYSFSFSFESGENNEYEKIGALNGNYSISGSILNMTILAAGRVNPETGSMETVKKSEDGWESTLRLFGIEENEEVPYSLNGEELMLTLGGTQLVFAKE